MSVGGGDEDADEGWVYSDSSDEEDGLGEDARGC